MPVAPHKSVVRTTEGIMSLWSKGTQHLDASTHPNVLWPVSTVPPHALARSCSQRDSLGDKFSSLKRATVAE